MLSALPHDYRAWTPYQVAHWLNSIGLTRWADAFQRHHISGNVLGLLDEEDLDELQLSGGNRTKLLKSIGMLSAQAARQLELQLEVTGAAATSGRAACSRCLLYTSPSPRDRQKSRMPSSA